MEMEVVCEQKEKVEIKQPRTEFDTPWKNIIENYFKDFIEYCCPTIYSEINWDKGYRFLDKELSRITRNAIVGNRILDKLVEVHCKNGQAVQVLIHFEIQGTPQKEFEERMFICRYRLYERYKKPIASIALLIDADNSWRPNCYRTELWGSSIEMRFSIVKLIDYRTLSRELETSNNRFAAVILAQLIALEKGDPENRLINKLNLIKWLYKREWSKDDIIGMLSFIDWVLALPEPYELKFQEYVDDLEEELSVSYVTSFERVGIKKGREEGIVQGVQKGIQQGESTILLHLLEYKFKTIPSIYQQKINQADEQTLLKWGERLLDCHKIEDIFEA